MPNRFLSRTWLGLSALAALAAIAYWSWPLGYWLNPAANRGLASDLEAGGQPYSWLFIALDIISGLLICGVAAWLLRALRRSDSLLLKVSLYGFGAFGLLTAVAAIVPIDCVSVEQHCGPVLQDPFFVIHGIASIGSVSGLTLSIIAMWWLLLRHPDSGSGLRWLLHGTALVWCAFGIITAALLILNRSSALSQHVFITICSLWTAVLPYLVWRLGEVAAAEDPVR